MLQKLLNKSSTQSSSHLPAGGMLGLVFTVYFLYSLLIKDKLLTTIASWSSECSSAWHVLAIGLLPVYLALIIFGAAIASIYLGKIIQSWLIGTLRR